MAYTALYRKFRPQTFESVIGQEHIVRTLKNQMKTGRVSHAYLFCGTRGTGKTSTAKIFARAINCTNPTADGEPCNECAVCKDILAGRSVNVIEIDAASNNGVDNIRALREEANFTPACVNMTSTSSLERAFISSFFPVALFSAFILETAHSHMFLEKCQPYRERYSVMPEGKIS